MIESEVGCRIPQAPASRLRGISGSVTDTGEPFDGALLDFLQAFEKISDVEWRENPQTTMRERYFKVKLFGRRSSKWKPLSALLEAVVKLFDNKVERNRQNACKAQESGAGLAGETLAAGE